MNFGNAVAIIVALTALITWRSHVADLRRWRDRRSPRLIAGFKLSTADGSLAPAWKPGDLARWTIEDVP